MPITLPPSLRRELHPVEEEVQMARELTPEARLIVLQAVCRTSMTLLAMNPHRDRILETRDPVPPSTVAAMARLRIPR